MLTAALPVLALAWGVIGQFPFDGPFPAHRVIGNVYYVGSKDLASYLITTPEGHILINSSFEKTVPIIKAGVESLGFKMRDVKILLASHAHSDHSGDVVPIAKRPDRPYEDYRARDPEGNGIDISYTKGFEVDLDKWDLAPNAAA